MWYSFLNDLKIELVLFLCFVVFNNTVLFFVIIIIFFFVVCMHTIITLVYVSISLFVNTSLTNPCFHLRPMLLTFLQHYQYIALWLLVVF